MNINRNALLAALVALMFALGFGAQEIKDAVDDASPPSPTTTTTTAPTTTTTTTPPTTTTQAPEPSENFFCDFSEPCELDQFVQYRDRHIVHSEEFVAEHAPTGLIACGPPETTRNLGRYEPFGMQFYCQPGGNPDLGHQMSFAPDTSGYSFTGSAPPLVFTDVERVSFEVNQTSIGGRAFWELAIIPAENAWVDAMPCIPALPCNDNFDNPDLGSYSFGNNDQEGSAFRFEGPDGGDGLNDRFTRASTLLDNGDLLHDTACTADSYCFDVDVHRDTSSVRDRFDVVVEQRDDGVWFGQEDADNTMHWVRYDGLELPDGPVRVVLKFHGYTPNKTFDAWPQGCTNRTDFCTESASVDGFTFHWDDFEVVAGDSVSSADFYAEPDEDRFVSHPYPGCVAFAEGVRGSRRDGNSGWDPIISCPEGLAEIVNGSNVTFGDYRTG